MDADDAFTRASAIVDNWRGRGFPVPPLANSDIAAAIRDAAAQARREALEEAAQIADGFGHYYISFAIRAAAQPARPPEPDQ